MYSYTYCSPPLLCTPQYPNKHLCYHKMFDNSWYLDQVFKNTAPQSTERNLYSKNYQFYHSFQNLITDKKKIIAYQEYCDNRKRINKAWIFSKDKKGRPYKYNSITKQSYYL